MTAEATGKQEPNDVKSASTCTFWCLIAAILLVGAMFGHLGRPFVPSETRLVTGGMERLGLLETAPWTIAPSPFAKFASAAITAFGVTERSLRLSIALALVLGAAALAHGSLSRGTTSAAVSMGLMFLPGAFSGVGVPFAEESIFLSIGSLLAWPLAERQGGVAVSAVGLAFAGLLAWIDPMAACVAAVCAALLIPTLAIRTRQLTAGLFSVTVALMAFIDPDRLPAGQPGFDFQVPGGITLGGQAVLGDGRLAIIIPFLVILANRWITSLTLVQKCCFTLSIAISCLVVPSIVPTPDDPRTKLDQIVTAMLPGDALVIGEGNDAWRIYARAGHVTRQHCLTIAPETRGKLAESLRRRGTRRAVITDSRMLPIPDCDPIGDTVMGFPLVSPQPRRN